jgi:hypothetical protein
MDEPANQRDAKSGLSSVMQLQFAALRNGAIESLQAAAGNAASDRTRWATVGGTPCAQLPTNA